MKFTSTRDNRVHLNGFQAMLQGISRDGGLFVPQEIPYIDKMEDLIALDYQELAFEIVRLYLDDFDDDKLRGAIEAAYGGGFGEDIVKLRKLGEVWFLELFHGPTLAFKDLALALLPRLLKEALKEEAPGKKLLILTATSGDTGKAALESFKDQEDILILVFYPRDGVSEIQRKQMVSQEGKNLKILAIEGDFDDAQAAVKELLEDEGFLNDLLKRGLIVSSANSINIGRLIPQIVYYFFAYFQLIKNKDLVLGDRVNFVVPSGNFGNILAAYYAKSMGLPVKKLICASNENRVLTDFFSTRTYDKRRKLIKSSSPSMDILVSSNLERLVYHLAKEETSLVKEKMEDLARKGHYSFEGANFDDFYADYTSQEEVEEVIGKLFNEMGYAIDPHTAVGYGVYEKYKKKTGDNTPSIILATASPFKFAKTMAQALGISILSRDEYELLKELSSLIGLEIPSSIKSLREKIELHKGLISPERVKKEVEGFIKEQENV